MKTKYFLVVLFYCVVFTSCSVKKPFKTSSATILFKTLSMKYYDLGFIQKYEDHINLNILNAGTSILKLDIYKDKICQSTFKCMTSEEFNKKYLSSIYKDDFLYNLFSQNKIYFKDKKNNILIKVKFSN